MVRGLWRHPGTVGKGGQGVSWHRKEDGSSPRMGQSWGSSCRLRKAVTSLIKLGPAHVG